MSSPLTFWERVDRRGPDECWPWTGPLNSKGYGRFQRAMVHRTAYTELVGPIPEGLVIDHLCRTRNCCNPAHMEPVTTWENTRRGISLNAVNASKSHCLNGHPFDEANTRIDRRGRRDCRACARVRATARLPRRREQYAEARAAR